MVNTVTFRTALKAVEKSFQNMSLKIYNFSTMQKYKDAMGLHRSKGTERQLHYEPAFQKDTKTGRYKCKLILEFKLSLGQQI